jgi:hypothetical protein
MKLHFAQYRVCAKCATPGSDEPNDLSAGSDAALLIEAVRLRRACYDQVGAGSEYTVASFNITS